MYAGYNGPRVHGGPPASSNRPAGQSPSTNGQRPAPPFQQISGNAGRPQPSSYAPSKSRTPVQNTPAHHTPMVPVPPSIASMLAGPSTTPARPAPSASRSRSALPVDLERVRGGRVTKASTSTTPRTSAQERVDQQRERRQGEARKKVNDLKARLTECEKKGQTPSKELRDAYTAALSTLSHYQSKPTTSGPVQIRAAPGRSAERPLPSSSNTASPPSQIPAAPPTSSFASKVFAFR